MITYAYAGYGDLTAVIRINSSGPSYVIIAVCTSEADAIAIVTALNA